MLLSLFCVGHVLLDMRPSIPNSLFPHETPLEKFNLSLSVVINWRLFCIRIGEYVHLSSQQAHGRPMPAASDSVSYMCQSCSH